MRIPARQQQVSLDTPAPRERATRLGGNRPIRSAHEGRAPPADPAPILDRVIPERREAMTADRPVRVRRALALAAAVAGSVTDVGYLRLITEQSTEISGRVVFFAAFVALMSALAVAGGIAVARGVRDGPVILVGAAGGFVGAGFIAAFSVGTPLLLAAALAIIAASPLRGSRGRAAAAFVGPLVLLVVGLVLTA